MCLRLIFQIKIKIELGSSVQSSIIQWFKRWKKISNSRTGEIMDPLIMEALNARRERERERDQLRLPLLSIPNPLPSFSLSSSFWAAFASRLISARASTSCFSTSVFHPVIPLVETEPVIIHPLVTPIFLLLLISIDRELYLISNELQ